MPELQPTGETEPKRKFGKAALYPYDVWFNGNPHYLVRGVDYQCSTESMRVQIYVQRKKRDTGLVLQTDSVQDAILMQAYPKDTDPPKLPPMSNARLTKDDTAVLCAFPDCGKPLSQQFAHLKECCDFPPMPGGWQSTHTGKVLGW